jgi:hypothetical protein
LIGKITKGQRFYGLLRYLAANPNSRQIDSTVSPSSREAAAELTAGARGQRALTNPVRHLMVRLPEAEALPDSEWRYVASVVLERLGYGDAPFVVVLHDDPAGAHIHIVTTARDYAGRHVSDSNDHHRIQTILRESARELGLAAPQPREARLPNADGPFRSVEAAVDADRVATAQRVRDCAAKAASFDAFSAALAELGLTVRASWSRSGALRGLSFLTPSGDTFKASDLDRALRRCALWEDFPALHRRGPAASPLPAVVEAAQAPVAPAANPPAEAPEARLAAALHEALARSATYPELVRHLESAGWTPQIVNHRFAYGIRFEKIGSPAEGSYRIAGSRLGPGYGLLALSRRFPHLFANALPPAREVPFSPHIARHLVAFEVPQAARSRMKLDPRFVAFAKGYFFASQKNARALEKHYGLAPLATLPAVRPRANPFGFAGFAAVAGDREAYRLARLRGLANRVLASHDPESREARRLLERLDRFARRVAPDSPSLVLQVLIQLPSCPVRSYRPEAGPVDRVALTGPAAERLRLGATGLVLADHQGVVWIDRAHLPQVERQFPALWAVDRLPAPAIDPRPLPSSSLETPGIAAPRQGLAFERMAAQDPGQVPVPWLLYVRALREPAEALAERSATQALAAFYGGDRSSANLLALASRPARLVSPRSSRELGTHLRAERVLTARLLRLARSDAPDLGKAALLAADLLALREAVNTRLRRQAGFRQPPSPRPRAAQASAPSPAEALRSINTFALYSLAHLTRAAGYWTALHSEDSAAAVGRLAMTGMPPFRHAARFAASVRGDDPMLSIARLYLVDGVIRAATVLAPKPLAALLTTARALVSTLKTVLSLGQERGRGR